MRIKQWYKINYQSYYYKYNIKINKFIKNVPAFIVNNSTKLTIIIQKPGGRCWKGKLF